MIIAMWSGPRNLSTAMMRSFGSREDCSVFDEPFFAPFLKVTGKPHPGRQETLDLCETDPMQVAELCRSHGQRKYSFQKHMPHHMLEGFPIYWARQAKNFFLIRHPARVISSYSKTRELFELDDLGFVSQRRLWEDLGRPPVIRSEAVLEDPQRALRGLCAAIDIDFDEDMLSWKAGRRVEDGPWAAWWYETVWRSTGFGPAPKEVPTLPPQYEPLLQACLKDYRILEDHALG